MLSSTTPLILRLATIEDAQNLLKLRNDDSVRLCCHNIKKIAVEEHMAWLKGVINNGNKFLYIAEINDIFVGMIRGDLVDGAYTLSWAVTLDMQGKGVGKAMLDLFIKQNKKPIRAEIKKHNISSIKIAESIGLALIKEADGVLYYQKDY